MYSGIHQICLEDNHDDNSRPLLPIVISSDPPIGYHISRLIDARNRFFASFENSCALHETNEPRTRWNIGSGDFISPRRFVAPTINLHDSLDEKKFGRNSTILNIVTNVPLKLCQKKEGRGRKKKRSREKQNCILFRTHVSRRRNEELATASSH